MSTSEGHIYVEVVGSIVRDHESYRVYVLEVKTSIGEVGTADPAGAGATAGATSRDNDGGAGPATEQQQPSSWTVYRRYNAFDQLRKKLLKSARTAPSIDELYFPPKAIFSNVRQSVISKRVKWLGEWMNNILSHPLDHVRNAPDLLAFVEAPEPEEAVVVFQKLPPPVRKTTPKWPEPAQVLAAAALEAETGVGAAALATSQGGSDGGDGGGSNRLGGGDNGAGKDAVTGGNATDGYVTSPEERLVPKRGSSFADSDVDADAFHDAEDDGDGDEPFIPSLSAGFGTDDDTDGVMTPSPQRPLVTTAEEQGKGEQQQHHHHQQQQRRQQHTYIAPTGTSATVADSSDDDDDDRDDHDHDGVGSKSNTVAGILTALVATTATMNTDASTGVDNPEWQPSPVRPPGQSGIVAAAKRAVEKKAGVEAATRAAAAAAVARDTFGTAESGTGAGSDDDKASLFDDGLTSGDDYASANETDSSSARNRMSSYASAMSGASDDDYLSAPEGGAGGAARNRISSYMSATSGTASGVESDEFFDANSSDGDGNVSGGGTASDASTESARRSKSFAKLRGRNVGVSRLTSNSNRSSTVFRSSPLTLSESIGSLSQITAQAAKQKVAAARVDAALRAADAEAPHWLATTVATRDRPINCICIWPAGSLFATGGRDGIVCTWELEPKVLRPASPQHGSSVQGAGHGTTIAAAVAAHLASSTKGCNEGDAPQRPVAELKGHTGWVRAIAFAPSGAVLASGGGDATVRLWSTTDWECMAVLNGHTGWVRALAFAAALPGDQNDSMRMVSGANDSVLRIWKEAKDTFVGGVSKWEEQTVLKGHKKAVLACCTRGAHVFSSSADGTVRVWALEDGHCLRVLTPQHQQPSGRIDGYTGNNGGGDDGGTSARAGSAGTVRRCHLHSCDSSEFEVFAVGSDGLLSAWKIGTWSVVPALQLGNGSSALRSLAAGQDGKRVIIAGDDTMLRAYEVVAPGGSRAEGYFKLEACGSGHSSAVLDVVVVPLGVGRGSSAITVSRDGSIKKWTPADELNSGRSSPLI